MASDRMFQVIVLGGIALVGAACGGNVIVDGAHAGGVGGSGGLGGFGGFPSEGPGTTTNVSSSSGLGDFPQEGGFAGFPQEGPVMDAGVDGFPSEADPPIVDAGDDAGFPHEAAVPAP